MLVHKYSHQTSALSAKKIYRTKQGRQVGLAMKKIKKNCSTDEKGSRIILGYPESVIDNSIYRDLNYCQ